MFSRFFLAPNCLECNLAHIQDPVLVEYFHFGRHQKYILSTLGCHAWTMNRSTLHMHNHNNQEWTMNTHTHTPTFHHVIVSFHNKWNDTHGPKLLFEAPPPTNQWLSTKWLAAVLHLDSPPEWQLSTIPRPSHTGDSRQWMVAPLCL